MTENIARPYVELGLKGSLGSIPYSGNIGLVANLVDQKSSGLSGGGGNLVTPVSASSTYSTVLPTLNLTFKLSDDGYNLLRVFVGRQEQRPRMYDMRASSNYSYDASHANSTTISPWGGNSGNPNLRPWESNSVDLDFEHYFAHSGGYFSVALFEKKLLSYIYQQNSVKDFTGYNYTSATPPLLHQGIVSQFVNGNGGSVQGVEATLEIRSELLTGGALKGFGLQVNGAMINSSIEPYGPGTGNYPLPYLSKKTANLQFYFEKDGFSARISDHYQADAREYIVTFGVPNFSGAGTPNDGYSQEKAFNQIDAQVSYSFDKGPLKGLGFYLEGRNLNNAPSITYNNGNTNEIMTWQKYGATYRAGVTYKF